MGKFSGMKCSWLHRVMRNSNFISVNTCSKKCVHVKASARKYSNFCRQNIQNRSICLKAGVCVHWYLWFPTLLVKCNVCTEVRRRRNQIRPSKLNQILYRLTRLIGWSLFPLYVTAVPQPRLTTLVPLDLWDQSGTCSGWWVRRRSPCSWTSGTSRRTKSDQLLRSRGSWTSNLWAEYVEVKPNRSKRNGFQTLMRLARLRLMLRASSVISLCRMVMWGMMDSTRDCSAWWKLSGKRWGRGIYWTIRVDFFNYTEKTHKSTATYKKTAPTTCRFS